MTHRTQAIAMTIIIAGCVLLVAVDNQIAVSMLPAFAVAVIVFSLVGAGGVLYGFGLMRKLLHLQKGDLYGFSPESFAQGVMLGALSGSGLAMLLTGNLYAIGVGLAAIGLGIFLSARRPLYQQNGAT